MAVYLGHNEEVITWLEQHEVEHRNYLIRFEKTVWPLFKELGYSKDTALLYWMMTQLGHNLNRIEDLLDDSDSYFD